VLTICRALIHRQKELWWFLHNSVFNKKRIRQYFIFIYESQFIVNSLLTENKLQQINMNSLQFQQIWSCSKHFILLKTSCHNINSIFFLSLPHFIAFKELTLSLFEKSKLFKIALHACVYWIFNYTFWPLPKIYIFWKSTEFTDVT